MRIMHLSDLHLGKRVNEFSMLEDQRYILDRISEMIEEEKPRAVVIAGDIYDKPLPPAEAVQLFDSFLSGLEEMELDVFIISGNHDSAERLSFGASIMDKRGIHFAGGYDGSIHRVILEDEYGEVCFYMLPFLKPSHVRAFIEKEYTDEDEKPEIDSYTDAVRFAVERMDIDRSKRNVLIAHQFCTGSERSESEEITVGGIDNVDASVFEDFDYTALGHLHGPQDTTSSGVRYCGSPLKYSFSEADQEKSVTMIELGAKNNGVCVGNIRTRGLVPLRDLKVIRGPFDQLTSREYYEHADTDSYLRVILTDEEDIIGALPDLRAIYPNIMRLEYDNMRTRAFSSVPDAADADSRTPLEIFAGLYEKQNGKPMSEDQSALMQGLIDKVWGTDDETA